MNFNETVHMIFDRKMEVRLNRGSRVISIFEKYEITESTSAILTLM